MASRLSRTAATTCENRMPASGRQRMLVIGSGGWLLSAIADVAVSLGGDRFVLTNPGNRELMLSGSAWLAQMDELIVPGASRQEIARLDGIRDNIRTRWAWFSIAGMPAASLVLGVVVWMIRRR